MPTKTFRKLKKVFFSLPLGKEKMKANRAEVLQRLSKVMKRVLHLH